ncbi:MAG: DNA alkylation repair protein [Fimbriimonadaceae bacterium]
MIEFCIVQHLTVMEELMQYPEYHDEVVAALSDIVDRKLGLAIRDDRGSELDYLGVRFPALRARVKRGFSFSSFSEDETVLIWDNLWKNSPWGDVLFAPLEHYLPIARQQPDIELWPVLRGWIGRVDNWCHCDQLSRIYSHLLEQQFESVYPQIVDWNQSGELWERRASLVSLIHYSGKNAVFLEPDVVLPMVKNCLKDNRYYVQTAVGWVLREMRKSYPREIVSFLELEIEAISVKALARAVDGMPREEAAKIKKLQRK